MRAWLRRTFILFCSLLGVLQQQAWGFPATCTRAAEAPPTLAPLPAELVVPRDAPEGLVLFDTQRWIQGGTADVTCGGFLQHGDLWLRRGFISGAGVPGHPNVYPSGVPGIGIRVAWSRDSKSLPAQMSGGEFMNSPRKTDALAWGRYTPASNWWIQLIKTGPISSGTYSIPNVEVHYHDERTNTLRFPSLAITFQARSCRLVDGRDRTRDLHKTWLKDFSGVGSTAWPLDVSINLDCDPGLNIAYRIDGLTHDESTLKNSTGLMMAKGVGVQLTDMQHVPLHTGREYPLGHSGVAGKTMQIPLMARYRQVEERIVPGHVITVATVTLFYR
ncbi:fimbrial protein [Pseudomonas sp. USHLN015]|uniref:fimbrial protein n=1 Tax=Pseudomonas sp. USHLN015 TaxID=3081296 RepID=UPI00301CFE00